MTDAAAATEPAPDLKGGIGGFFAKFSVMKNGMRELWVVFAIKFLVIAAYGLTNATLVLWLSSDFGFSDKKALGFVAGWSLIMSICTVLSGSVADVIGLRRTFFLGVGICAVARAVMVFAQVKWLAILGGLAPLAVGEALTGPILVAAVRRYSNTRQRSLSFSMIYAIMNGGFLVASLLFDFVRQGLGEHGHFNIHLTGYSLSTYRALLLVAFLIECIIFPLIFFLREGAEATDHGVRLTAREAVKKQHSVVTAFFHTVTRTASETVSLLGKLFSQSGIYRLLAFLVFIAFLKLIFIQMYYVYPVFGIRVLGDNAPVGRLWAVNSFLVILLVPMVGALTQRFSAYSMVIAGGTIAVMSVFIMALPPVWFQPLADSSPAHWIGHWYLGLNGKIHPYYAMIFLFVVLLSVGETFYSPRVYEYAASIAPKGQESSYSALSFIPLLLAKAMIGGFAGLLLENYCPKIGPRHPSTMWLLVALGGMISPVGLLALGKYIRVPEAGRA